MTTTLEELITPMTVDEAKTAIYDALAARGVTTTGWKPGAVARTIIGALAIILSAFSELQASLARSGFLDLAEGAWLTLLARYVYDVERDTGSFATGTVTLTNTTGSIYSGDPGDLVFLNSTTGKTYRNTKAYSLGSMGMVTVDVEAIEIGTASYAAAGEIDALVTTLNGVEVENASALVGADEETDALLRLRCRESLGRLSPNGPKDAYAYFARSTTNSAGASIGVTRVREVPDGFGGVTVYVATASGGVTGDADDPDTDLGAIQEAFDENVEPIGITATATSATTLTVAVTYELWVRDTIGMSESEITTAVGASLTSAISDAPIGGERLDPEDSAGFVFVDTLEAAIDDALPAGSIIKRTITLPAADVAVTAGQAPVVGTITPTSVHFVTRRAS